MCQQGKEGSRVMNPLWFLSRSGSTRVSASSVTDKPAEEKNTSFLKALHKDVQL